MHGVIAILIAPTPPRLSSSKNRNHQTLQQGKLAMLEAMASLSMASFFPAMHYHEHDFIFVKKLTFFS
jgi:hypothetical protein